MSEINSKYNLTENQIHQLEEWTELQCSDILYDTEVDSWAVNTCELNERIIGKKQITFLIEDEDGEKFGYFHNGIISDEIGVSNPLDDKTFIFNLESNGRLQTPMKFEPLILDASGLFLFEKELAGPLISLSEIKLNKIHEKYSSFCGQEGIFDCKGIENAYCGKAIPLYDGVGNCFVPKRIMVIQMI